LGVNYTVSQNLRDLAEPIVREYYKTLVEYRVPMEFVFSDQETKDKSRHKGHEVKVIKNLQAWLADHPRSEQFYDAYTYVCNYCINWSSGIQNEIEVGGKKIGVCDKCATEISHLDLTQSETISRLLGNSVTARKRQLNGYEEQFGLFVIVVHENAWLNWNDEKRLYVLDHCLAQCYADKDKKNNVRLAKRQYELQEFVSVLERHSIQVATNVSTGGRIEDAVKKNMKANLFSQEDQAEEEAVTIWSKSVPYAAGQLVFGSDGATYSSVTSGNLGFDPADNSTYWRYVSTVLPEHGDEESPDGFKPTEAESEAGKADDEDDLAALADDPQPTEPAFPNKSGRSRRKSGGDPTDEPALQGVRSADDLPPDIRRFHGLGPKK
jgi:hypothetical protein